MIDLLFIAVIISLIAGLVKVTNAALKISRRIERYELFFRGTIVDIDRTRNIFDQLVNKREYLAESPEIQEIQKVFAATLDILEEYIKYGRELTTTITTKEEEEKEEEE